MTSIIEVALVFPSIAKTRTAMEHIFESLIERHPTTGSV
jgi:hypothetical protein